MNMSGIQRIALLLTIIGAINWGLIGFFQFDLVASLFGGQESMISRIIYSLVGICGLINLGLLFTTKSRTRRDHPKLVQQDNESASMEKAVHKDFMRCLS